jgi:DNA-binding NarL/FixJ family response regulator
MSQPNWQPTAQFPGKRSHPEDAGCRKSRSAEGDVVIVDYLMPKMNGQEGAMEMKRLKPQAPIIMLSAAVDVPEQALQLVDAFIAKESLGSQLLPIIAQL